MEVRVLGVLEISGARAPLTAAKPRLLLAVLSAAPNATVPVDRLVDALWPGVAPRTAAKTVQTYVLHVRRALGPGRILRRPSGYELRLAEDELDRTRFGRLVATARADLEHGAVRAAVERLEAALGLWRGDPYVEFADCDALRIEAARLEEARLNAVEIWAEAKLSDAPDPSLIEHLEVTVERYPLREHLTALLMCALYRTGRQADALRVYQRARELLVETLGVEPGTTLRAVERAILCQDDDAVTVASPPAVSRPTTRYARSTDGVHVAYQVSGSGPAPLLVLGDWFGHVEWEWEEPSMRAFLRTVGSFARVIRVDQRGTGLSDPVDPATVRLADYERDATAVLDAVGIERAPVLAGVIMAPAAVLMAASAPHRFCGLVLVNGLFSHARWWEPATLAQWQERFGTTWGTPVLAPSRVGDAAFDEWFGRFQRLAVSPGQLAALPHLMEQADVSGSFSKVRVPVVVVHREANVLAPADDARTAASRMPNARYVPVPGADVAYWLGDNGQLVREIEAMLRATTAARAPRDGLTGEREA